MSGIDVIRYLLNISDDNPRTQIGTLLDKRFVIRDSKEITNRQLLQNLLNESSRSPGCYAVTGLPMFTCPKCHVESQIDDYYRIEAGSQVCCPNCESEITVLEKWETIEIRVTA